MKYRLVSVAVATLLSAPLASHAIVYTFNASLDGLQETPPNASPATGVATLSYDNMGTLGTADDTYNFALSVFGLVGAATPTMAHIHAPAPAGVPGPVVVPLAAGGLPVAPFAGALGPGFIVLGGGSVPTPYAGFLTDLSAGLAYVNVHSAAFPGGEARGQLIEVVAVPEPATYAMLLGGLGIVGFVARRRRPA